MKPTRMRKPLVDPALEWSHGLKVEVGGAGTVAHAGIVLPRLVADRVGLTTGLSGALARAGFIPGRDRGRALSDAVACLAVGATCLSDIEAMTSQVEIFGPSGGASDSTLLRVLDEVAERLNDDELPARRLAKVLAAARRTAWGHIVARHGQLPAVKVAGVDLVRAGVDGEGCRPILVVRLDATLIEAHSSKDKAAGHFKGGYGFHPLSAWCTNVGDNLAVMLRPGNAGSSTASDHILVLDTALAQIPPAWRTDVLVTVDGAGASGELIKHLTKLNTAPEHGRRGRRVEYSIGWACDERTMTGLGELPESAWVDALGADGKADPTAQVADLTGILRHGPDGDRMERWPADQRVIVRRTPRPATKPAKLGEHPDFEYRAVHHQHPGRATAVAGRPPPHPGPRRGQHEDAEGLRGRDPAFQELQPQQRLAPARRAGLLGERLATPHRPGRGPGQSRTESVAVQTLRRTRPVHHARPPSDPESPARLGMGPRRRRRLRPPPSPAPRLTPNPPIHPRSAPLRPERGTRHPPRAPSGDPPRPNQENPHDPAPNLKRSWTQNRREGSRLRVAFQTQSSRYPALSIRRNSRRNRSSWMFSATVESITS